jgi:hypothetical protein
MMKSPALERGSRTGLIPRGRVVSALILTLRSVLIALMVLSLFGTFYALLGVEAPFPNVFAMLGDVMRDSGTFLMALGAQLLFSLVQWGSASLAKEDRRWWFLYLLALAPSAWMNIQSYAQPTLEVFGWNGDRLLIVVALIIAFDIAPEKALQR